jgi:hypothetical protein
LWLWVQELWGQLVVSCRRACHAVWVGLSWVVGGLWLGDLVGLYWVCKQTVFVFKRIERCNNREGKKVFEELTESERLIIRDIYNNCAGLGHSAVLIIYIFLGTIQDTLS